MGSTTAASLDAAKKVYDKTFRELESSIDFECEPEGGGRCDKFETYWYAIWSHFHICSSWKNKSVEDDRILSMLVGLYGYLAGVDDNVSRIKYAMLARDLTKRFWS